VLGDLGVVGPELRGEPRIGVTVLILEAAEQRRKLDCFDVLPARPMRLRHGEPSRAWLALEYSLHHLEG
jgi:hypothetical protein